MKPTTPPRALCLVLMLPLLGSLLCAVYWSLHWPLLGDASLMHYVVFLMDRGMKPYKDIVDVNLPGSYFFESLNIRLFNGGALAWRLYDLGLLFSVGVAALLITTRRKAFAAFFAASIFALIHMQDGILQIGQRDLLIAALILCSYAALFIAQRSPKPAPALILSALFMGATFPIKPFFLPLGILLLFTSAWQRCRSNNHPDYSLTLHFAYGTAGLLLPPLCAVLWLYTRGSLAAFSTIATSLIPFHASLAHRPFFYLLAHITSPISVLFALWLLLLAVTRPQLTLERFELYAGMAIALLSYLVQGKGFPYHRYPFLALLLLVIAMDLVEALARPRIPQLIAAMALVFACFGLAPRAAWLVRSFTGAPIFQQSLSAQLSAFGPQLSGQVQCLDTVGGCINTLYDLRIVQSTGYLYDCYLFTPQQTPVTARYRADFWAAFQSTRPKVVVMTDEFCLGNPEGFRKLDHWPQLREELAHTYVQTFQWQSSTLQRLWARLERPFGYRIYVRKDSGWIK